MIQPRGNSKTLTLIVLATLFLTESGAHAGVCDIDRPASDPTNTYLYRMQGVFNASLNLMASTKYVDVDKAEKGFDAIVTQCYGSRRDRFDNYLWSLCRRAARNRGIALERIGKLYHACLAWDTAADWGDSEARNWHRNQCVPEPAFTHEYSSIEDLTRNQFWYCSLVDK